MGSDLFRRAGCDACDGKSYLGRIARALTVYMGLRVKCVTQIAGKILRASNYHQSLRSSNLNL